MEPSCNSTTTYSDSATSLSPPSLLLRLHHRRRRGSRMVLATWVALMMVVLRSVRPSVGFSPVVMAPPLRLTSFQRRQGWAIRAQARDDEEEEEAPSPSGVDSTSSNAEATATSLPQKVQVCGFKDCRRVGGGKKLEAMVLKVLEEEANGQGSANDVDVEVCDCLGECGYGPNMLVDGQIVNGVRGRQAVLQALGIATSSSTSASAPPAATTVGTAEDPEVQVPSPQEAPSRAQA